MIDTPEVAQAKAAHFAEFARAAARAAAADQKPNGLFGSGRAAYPSPAPAPVPAQGPVQPQHFAQSFGIPSGYNSINPRPEIGFPRHYEAPVAQNYGPIPKNYVSSLPPKPSFAPAPLAEDGRVIDTPEVAALKAARLQELADAEARAYKYAQNNNEEYINEGTGYQTRNWDY